MKTYFNLLLVSLIMLSACRSVQPEVPSLAQERLAAVTAPPSQIDIPVQVQLKPIYNLIEKNVPLQITSKGYPNWEDGDNCMVQYRWSFWRQKLNFSAKGNSLNINCLGYYHGEAQGRPCCWDFCPWAGAGCGIGEPERQVSLSINCSVSVLPNYAIGTSTSVARFDALTRCKVTSFDIDVTDYIVDAAVPEINTACKDFDKSMAAFSFKNQVQEVWDMMQKPIPIDTLGVLLFQPTSLRISPFAAKDDILKFNIGMSAQPRFMLSADAPETVPPLPNLAQGNAVPGGFYVYLDARLNYDELTQMVKPQVQNMRFDFGKRKYIEIIDVELLGKGNSKLVIKVQFKGSTKGWMYLTGTPQYDSAKQLLTLPDLDFDLKTKNVLIKSAKWLFNNKITNTMRENANFNVADILNSIKTELEINLNKNLGNGITTFGSVHTLDIEGIIAQPEYLQIRTFIGGNIDALVTLEE